MDPRIERHAEILVDHSTSVQPGDNVVVQAPPQAEDLVVALYERLGTIGAFPSLHWHSPRPFRAYARAMDVDDFDTPTHELAEMEEADVVFMISGGSNLSGASDVSPEKRVASNQANEPVLRERLDTRWVITQYPTTGHAQKAEMSTEAYEDFVWNAIDRDWEEQRAFQQQMADILTGGDEVRIVSGETTDLTMSIAGMQGANDYGKRNMPGGEAFTVPVRDSVDGEVVFDKPLVHSGREIQDVYLRFEDGKAVEFDAARNEDVLASQLDTDEGARYLGELGIGMNRGIDRFTYNMLFDEKMGDTVHLAVGDALDECIPEDGEKNDSAIHIDMIVDMSEESFIEVDGEVVQRNGTFRFEEGFEG